MTNRSCWLISHCRAIPFTLAVLAGFSGFAQSQETVRQDFAPKISPDGTQIAFYGYGANDSPDLYVINVDGSDERQLTDTPDFWEILPQWSPDGKRLFFTGGRRLGEQIFSINLDGTDRRAETHPPEGARDFDASVALHKNRFVYLRNHDSGLREIIVQDIETGASRVILSHNIENLEISRMSLHADGHSLLFTGSMGVAMPPFPADLYMLDIDTGRSRQLTFSPSEWERQALLSRDGNWIMFSHDLAGSNDIYRMPVAGGDRVQVTFFDDAIEFFSDWQGDLFAFDAGHYPDGETCLYTSNPDGGNVRRITGHCEFRSQGSN